MSNTEKRKVGRPRKYHTDEERKAAKKAWVKKTKDKVRNVTLTAEPAERFIKLRDKYNKESGLPFDLTNSQFFALMLAKWEQS